MTDPAEILAALAVTLAEDRFRLASMGRVHRQWIARAVTRAVGEAGLQ